MSIRQFRGFTGWNQRLETRVLPCEHPVFGIMYLGPKDQCAICRNVGGHNRRALEQQPEEVVQLVSNTRPYSEPHEYIQCSGMNA